MSSGRIYDDKYNRDSVSDERPDNIKEIEAKIALATDLVKEDNTKPPTRMQRKFNRMFGAGK